VNAPERSPHPADAAPITHYENFPVASWLCPPRLRPPIAAIYHFARTADDIADEGDASAAARLAEQKIQWSSFAELNAWLGERCRALWSEVAHPEFKQFSVLEMLEQERGEMMPMPTVFDGYVERSAKVSSTCLVAVARNRYSVPCELAGQRVSTRLYPSRVEIASD
jgi:phytoene/squalene synthetase